MPRGLPWEFPSIDLCHSSAFSVSMELAVLGAGESVRVNTIFCLGRNYRAHAEELGNPVPAEPVVFLKPNSSAIRSGQDIVVPEGIGVVHHEVELAVVIKDTAKDAPEETAHSHVLGYAVMLDITARDVQSEAKKRGLPWTMAKGLDTFAPISDVVPAERVGNPHDRGIRLIVNGKLRQDSSTSYMIFNIPQIIAFISSRMTLQRGDVIATGTPEGVAPLCPGDEIVAEIDGVGRLEHRVVERR